MINKLCSTKAKPNIFSGTQGGTFTRHRENPISRARRLQARQDMNYSSSSSDSEQSFVTSDDATSMSAGEPSSGTAFMVSDTHSINGKRV